MLLAFVDEPPSYNVVEKIRLILSTYQDGTGMLAARDNKTLPGWRDFERAVALALSGVASESKAVFDVVLARPDAPAPKYGLSCKMRRELNRIDRDGRVTLEVSNAAGEMWDYLLSKGITDANYLQHPELVGKALMELVWSWHQAASVEQKGAIDVSKSSYLLLSWNTQGEYQLHQFGLDIINPNELTWSFPNGKTGRRLCGNDGTGNKVEWYGKSGGQPKYFPYARDCQWQSERFRLEPLPDAQHGILNKVAAYFPTQWQNTEDTQ